MAWCRRGHRKTAPAKSCALLASLLAAATLLPGGQQGGTGKPVRFATTTRLVEVEVEARDGATGKTIAGLVPDDFEIWDEGEPRAVSVFRFGVHALDIVLVLDTTGEFGRAPYGSFYEELREILDSFSTLDRTAVIAVGERKVALTAPLTQSRLATQQGVHEALRRRGSLREGSSPRLYDALEQAALVLSGTPAPGRRRLIIVWTHNRAAPKPDRSRRTLAALLERNVTVFACVNPAVAPPGVEFAMGVPGPGTIWRRGTGPGWLPEKGALDRRANRG